jgi:membrane-associated protease RseP (regulator of RpoE activity)
LSNETPAPPSLHPEHSEIPSDLSDSELYAPAYPLPPPRRKFKDRVWRHVLLFAVTILTTTVVGADHYRNFLSEFGRVHIDFEWPLLWKGFWYSGTLLLILGAHEMGHYLLCRRYHVDATLPYFIPAPLPLTGTLGAVIRIREAFPTRTVLFDIGVAGPLFGFAVLVPALFLGMSLSTVIPAPTEGAGLSLGEPLLFRWATHAVFGAVPDGYTINMHPMVFAAWFGMLATALNLLPFGQLDGGHITYATLGRLSTPISIATVGVAIVMTLVTTSWMFMTLMMLAMLFFLGPRHPSVINEYEPLSRGRVTVALVALAVLIVCFTPVPIEPYDLIRNP